MAEEQDGEITFSSTNSSKEQQNGEQVYKITSDRQQRTSGAQKSSPLSSKGGRTKILKIKKGTQKNKGRRPVPGRESQQRKFPITRKPSHWRVWGKFSDLGGQPNWEEKLNKAHRLRAKGNSQQKSTPDARTRHQQEGANGEEPVAFLRVGTGQMALRAVGGGFF